MSEILPVFESEAINFPSNSYRTFIRFFMYDSIFLKHPYAEVIFTDKSGLFFYDYGLIENVDVTLGMGNDQIGFTKHNFYYRDFNMALSNAARHITGKLNMFFKSTFKKQDSVKSRSFKGNISDIVKEIANEYTYPTQKKSDFITVSDTDNEDTWYQAEMNDEEFLKILSENALSTNNEDSPFIYFWNLHSEFRFMDIQSMLLQTQERIPTIKFSTSQDVYQRRWYVMNYGIVQRGSSKNMPNYNKKVYSIEPDSSETLDEYDFSKIHLPTSKKGEDKMLLRKNDTENVRDHKYYGLINDINENNFEGWTNQQYIDSILPVRFDLSIAFDTTLSAGRMIDLIVYKPDGDTISKQYSGRYLITESRHLIDEKGTPITTISVGKNGTKIDKENLYFAELVSK